MIDPKVAAVVQVVVAALTTAWVVRDVVRMRREMKARRERLRAQRDEMRDALIEVHKQIQRELVKVRLRRAGWKSGSADDYIADAVPDKTEGDE